MQLSVRKLLAVEPEELVNILTGEFSLQFDDGIILETNAKETIYSSFFWDFHRRYPNTPLMSHHHVQFVLKGNPLTSKTHIDLLNIVFWDTVDFNNINDPKEKDYLVEMIYKITNRLYNAMVYMTEDSVMSIDILDFIQIGTHPTIIVEQEKIDSNPGSIDSLYKATINLINHDENLRSNAIVKSVRSKMVNNNQILQCVAARGYVSEVDGVIMPIPVTRNYTQGMRTVYNHVAESRTAAKALYYSESPLQDSEYFARRLQLMTMYIEKISTDDCGSTDYLEWFIEPEQKRNEKVIYPGDLPFMSGKIYLDPETQQFKILKKSDTHLIGKTIKMRHVLGCKHPDSHSVCRVCYGQLADNIMSHANLGHISSGTLTKETSQNVLSVKHVDSSSSSDPIYYTDILKRYFTPSEKPNDFYVRKDLAKRGLKVVIPRDEAYGLTDINQVDSVKDMSVNRISSLTNIGFSIDNESENTPSFVEVAQRGRNAFMTTELLLYVKQKGWTINQSNAFVIDLCDWNFDYPIFKLPEMEYSYAKHSKQIASIIEARMEDMIDRLKPESDRETLKTLFRTSVTKLNANFALFEIIVYALKIRDPNTNDYRLARNSPNSALGVKDTIMRNRSMSVAYAYESQGEKILSPFSFYAEGRPDSIFDVFICPNEVLANNPGS